MPIKQDTKQVSSLLEQAQHTHTQKKKFKWVLCDEAFTDALPQDGAGVTVTPKRTARTVVVHVYTATLMTLKGVCASCWL